MKIFFCLISLLCFFSNSAFAFGPKNLEVKTFDGKNFDLKKLRGKKVIVSFWAHWCGNCRREMIKLEELYNKCPGIDIIGLSVDGKEEKKSALARASKLNYPNALLENAKVNNFPEIEAVPTTYLINKDGVAQEINEIPTCSQLK